MSLLEAGSGDQGVGRAALLQEALGKDLLQASFLLSSSSLGCDGVTPYFAWHSPCCESLPVYSHFCLNKDMVLLD